MKPLFVLLSTFALSCMLSYYTKNGLVNYRLSGCIALAVMMAFTSVAHFVFWRGMMLMLPKFMPCKKEIVYLTGVIELLAAAGLLFSATRTITGIWLIVFFVTIMPANITAARQRVNLEKADYTGSGIQYLWFRIPLQLLFIGWVYWFAL